MALLAEAAIFLTAAVIAVPLFRRLKLGAVIERGTFSPSDVR